MSGQVVFVQVKCRGCKKRADGKYRVPIESKQLKRNLQAWRRVVGAAILILVDPETLVARWVDLKDTENFTATQVLVPSEQLFDTAAKHQIEQLCGTLHRDLQAPRIDTSSQDFLHLRSRDHIQKAARQLFVQLEKNPVYIGGDGPPVHFNRHGWRHITRPKRSELTRYQSFVLLGCVRKVLTAVSLADVEATASITLDTGDQLIPVRAMVSFPFRQTGLIKILLRRTNRESSQSYSFHTVYEPRRKLSAIGVREPRRL